jgi:hypothetical protein
MLVLLLLLLLLMMMMMMMRGSRSSRRGLCPRRTTSVQTVIGIGTSDRDLGGAPRFLCDRGPPLAGIRGGERGP